MTLKKIAKELCPPIMWKAMRAIFKREEEEKIVLPPAEAEYAPDGWDTKLPEQNGWNIADIAEENRRRCEKIKEICDSTAPLQIWPHFRGLTTEDHNAIMSLGYVLSRALSGAKELSILDWGGSVGYYRMFCEALMPEVKFDYHCRDMPAQTTVGKELFTDTTYYTTDEECFSRSYDLVIASSSLFYPRNRREIMQRMVDATKNMVYVALLPVCETVPTYVFLNRAYKYGYNSEYLGNVINRAEFMDDIKSTGAKLVREFFYSPKMEILSAPECPSIRGFLLRTDGK